MPYYIGGEIENRDDLLIASPERLRKRYRIDIRTSQEVINIDRDNNTVTVEDHSTGVKFTEAYDKLLLSPGAVPTKPSLPGVDSDRIFTLRDLPDSDSIKNYLDRNKVDSAIIMGGGSIGMEMVENFSRLGVSVTVVEKQNQLMNLLDREVLL